MDGINQVPVDRFTAAHFVFGILMGLLHVSPLAAMAIAAGWEVVESPLKRWIPWAFPHPEPDAPLNAVLDAAATMFGWTLGNLLWALLGPALILKWQGK